MREMTSIQIIDALVSEGGYPRHEATSIIIDMLNEGELIEGPDEIIPLDNEDILWLIR
jgi:hypothetical protein